MGPCWECEESEMVAIKIKARTLINRVTTFKVQYDYHEKVSIFRQTPLLIYQVGQRQIVVYGDYRETKSPKGPVIKTQQYVSVSIRQQHVLLNEHCISFILSRMEEI